MGPHDQHAVVPETIKTRKQSKSGEKEKHRPVKDASEDTVNDIQRGIDVYVLESKQEIVHTGYILKSRPEGGMPSRK